MARRVGTQFLIVRTDILPTRIYYPELRQSMDLAVVDWSDRVDEIVAVVPERCRHCQQPLPEPAGRRAGRVWRHQVVELLPLAVRVTEYQMIARRCPSYGKRTRPDRPAGVPRRPFGARLTAVIGLLSGRYRLSRGEVRQVLQDLWHVRLSLGAVVRRRHATGAERLLLADLRCHGDTFWTRFSGGRDGTLWYYLRARRSVPRAGGQPAGGGAGPRRVRGRAVGGGYSRRSGLRSAGATSRQGYGRNS